MSRRVDGGRPQRPATSLLRAFSKSLIGSTPHAAGALGDDNHLVFDCASLAALRVKYADLFQVDLNMRSFFTQQNQLRDFLYVADLECFDSMRI